MAPSLEGQPTKTKERLLLARQALLPWIQIQYFKGFGVKANYQPSGNDPCSPCFVESLIGETMRLLVFAKSGIVDLTSRL